MKRGHYGNAPRRKRVSGRKMKKKFNRRRKTHNLNNKGPAVMRGGYML